MADGVVTQVAVEAVSLGTPDLRVSQLALDVLTLPPSPPGRVSQVAVEVLSAPAPGTGLDLVLLVGAEVGVVDESSYARTLTLVGNAARTTAQAKYGAASVTFDGAGDRVVIADSVDFTFGTGAFTLEGWFRFLVKTTEQALMGQWDSASWFFFVTGAQLVFRVSGAADVAAAFVPTLGTWYHLCAERSGTTARVYVNGAVIATNASFGVSIPDSPSAITLGAIGTVDTFPAFDFNGQMDEVRLSKGVARYNGAFTAPTGPFPRPGGATAAVETTQHYVWGPF